jgi:hypothetical protein
MKPIAQTFLVSQPNTGIDGVFLTKINVYFKSVSSTYGISIEIRTVENGFPTSNKLSGGKHYLYPSVVVASDDASLPTTFSFVSPPFLQTNVQYAMVLIPDGGNDEYEVWTGELGGVDVTTNAPIYTNNQLGNLFISSNDLVFTPIITESMKYDLYIADFAKGNTSITSASANLVFRPVPTEFVKINNTVGSFYNTERVMVSNSNYVNATTYSNNTILVPNSTISDLAVNNTIYVSTLDRTAINFVKVVSAPTSTTITVNNAITFSNTSCMFGRVAGDGALYATLQSQLQYYQSEEVELVLKNFTANTTLNFANSAGQLMFGVLSGASANITAIANKQYDSITPHLNFINPAQTAVSFAYQGYSNATVKDTSPIPALDNLPNEFNDFERIFISRSNALANASIGTNNSLMITASLSTSNTDTAPYIDRLATYVTITYNSPTAQTQLTGYYLSLSNTAGVFNEGETITQANTVTGVIDGANSSYIRVNLVANGVFAANASAVTGATSGATANVIAVTYFDEMKENGYYKASRYISKNVILADQQDAEDLNCYLTAYRPTGTQFFVYGKFLNGSDTDTFSNKDWSYMPEADISTALFSSAINRDDTVELQFGLPTTVQIDTAYGTSSSTSTNVTVADTSFYTANTFVYIADRTSAKFNVRKISSIANNTTLTLSSNVSFTSSNVSVGTIPGLQSQSGAFLFANNNGIVRYVTGSDVVYDSYKTFAVKIVPISNNSILVPIMKNMRCLALQV